MKAQVSNKHIEESADELIRKLEGQGKRVKIINEGEDDGDDEMGDINRDRSDERG